MRVDPQVSLASSIVVLLASCLLPVRAQYGSDCSDSIPCTENRVCSLGYCRCPPRHIKSTKDCLPERSFNETCEHDDQCVDFRLKCSDGRCTCVKYYHWDEYSSRCLTQIDLKYMLSDMEEKFNPAGKLNAETHQVFTGLVWTGLAVMVVGLILASLCLFYGCCYGRLCCGCDNNVSKSKNSGRFSQGDSACRFSQRTGEITLPGSTNNKGQHGSGSQEAVVDYIPALYETSSFEIA